MPDLRNCGFIAMLQDKKHACEFGGYTDGNLYYAVNGRAAHYAPGCAIVHPYTGVALANCQNWTAAAEFAETDEFKKILSDYCTSKKYKRDRRKFEKCIRKLYRRKAEQYIRKEYTP